MQQAANLTSRQYHRQALRHFGNDHVVDPGQLGAEDVAVQKKYACLGLILRRRRNVAGHRQMTQKLGDLFGAHVAWMPFSVKQNEALDPIDISIFCPNSVMHDTQLGTQCVEQLGALS